MILSVFLVYSHLYISYLIDEMEAIGEGMCSALGGDCNVTEMTGKVKRLNMFPELIKMACTAFGAWGPASSRYMFINLKLFIEIKFLK